MEHIPILCVDLLIINDAGEYLLVKRKDEPMKGRWWIVGGRILKGESLTKAAKRKAKEEIGAEISLIVPLGFYEEHYKHNIYDLQSGIHTVSVVFLAVTKQKDFTLDKSSSKWQFSKKLPSKLANVQPFNLNLINKSRELLTDDHFYKKETGYKQ